MLLAGGIANADDTRAALAAGADGVVAGTRFLLTHESRAHPEYQRRILAADKTFRTTLFGLGWPAPHRVVANAATRRWCHDDGTRAGWRRGIVNAGSGVLARLPDAPRASVSPAAPRAAAVLPRRPDRGNARLRRWTARRCTPVETVLRITSVISARQAVADLAPGGQ